MSIHIKPLNGTTGLKYAVNGKLCVVSHDFSKEGKKSFVKYHHDTTDVERETFKKYLQVSELI